MSIMTTNIFMVTMFALAIEGSIVPVNTNQLALCEGIPPQFFGGYEYFHNIGYYKLYTLETTWGKAWNQCKNDGGHLLVINSDEEYEAILDLIRETDTTTSAFIGVHDYFLKDHHVTVTGEDMIVSRYNVWDDGEPRRYDSHRCVKIGNRGRLFMEECSKNSYFICEISFRCNESD